MSINTDGTKKSGKFLKKGSKLLNSVRMSQYSFSQIGQDQNIEFDNLDRNIIHAKFHSNEELVRNVKESERINEVLFDPSHPPMAIIMPGDFTQDWFNERSNNKRRLMGFDDEDDYDDPYGTRGGNSANAHQPKNPIAQKAQEQAPGKIDAKPTSIKTVAAADPTKPMDASELLKKAHPVSIVKEPYSLKNATETEVAVLGGSGQSSLASQAQQANREDDFIPLEQPSPLKNAEDDAIAAYKNRAEVETANAELLENLKSDAQAQGYNDGFRVGEEKGVLSGQKTAGAIFTRVSELLKEFEGLKRNVLENIQKNFFELSQAVAEALLEREFSVKPEAFAKVLEKVLKDTVSDDQFKIRLHPETWQRVNDLKISTLDGHLIKDAAIPVGEFKVESNLTVVDGNVKKIVAQMLQNVDLNLFEETKVAS